MRKIIHVDMDAFYASVEQRDHPQLRGRPVAVGGSSPRGVVMAASYEARAFGIRSAMPSITAARRCPDLVFVRPRFDAYKEVSRAIREIFLSYTELVEPLSLDEAYLDVTRTRRGPPSATLIARAIKAEIRALTGLTASAGVSFNKFLAKVASAMDKPDGLFVIRPEDAPAFLRNLKIEKFFGVGPVTARRLKANGIHTGADVLAHDEAALVRLLGSAGAHYRQLALGRDDREVRPDRPSKSIGAEQTFAEDLRDAASMLEALEPIARKIVERANASGRRARTLTLKIKHHDFTTRTRRRTFDDGVALDRMMALVRQLLYDPEPPARPVRLLGLALSNFRSESEGQLTLRL